MSDLYINIRIFDWHFQVSDKWKVRISNNADSHSRKNYPDGKFRVYQFFN